VVSRGNGGLERGISLKAKIRLPFVEPAIFLSSTSLSCRLQGLREAATFQRGRPAP
jgi:hypothetical protein